MSNQDIIIIEYTWNFFVLIYWICVPLCIIGYPLCTAAEKYCAYQNSGSNRKLFKEYITYGNIARGIIFGFTACLNVCVVGQLLFDALVLTCNHLDKKSVFKEKNRE